MLFSLLGWLLVEIAYSCTLTWTLSSWLSCTASLRWGHRLGWRIRFRHWRRVVFRLLELYLLFPFPGVLLSLPVIQTLGVDRRFLVPDRRHLRRPFPCSVLPTIFASFSGTPPHYPGGGICPPYGQAACPHCPRFSAGSPAPGQPPPGSGAASSF